MGIISCIFKLKAGCSHQHEQSEKGKFAKLNEKYYIISYLEMFILVI